MRPALAVAGLLPALLACTPLPPLSTRLQPWIGKSELDLVAALGVPAGTYEVEGVKFIQFTAQRTILAPNPYPVVWSYGRWGAGWGAAGYPAAIVVNCEVTFALRRGVVESFTFRGEGCR